MNQSQTLALARLQQARIEWWRSIQEHDDAIVAGIEAGLTSRQMAAVAGIDQSAIVRRAARLGVSLNQRSET